MISIHLLPVRVLKGQKQDFFVQLFEDPLLLLLRLVQAGERRWERDLLSDKTV